MLNKKFSRRSFLTAFAAVAAGSGLSGCMQPANSRTKFHMEEHQPTYLWGSRRPGRSNPRSSLSSGGEPFASRQDMAFYYPHIYAARKDGGFMLAAVPYMRVNPQYLRQMVDDPTGEKPGVIVVDRARHYLYLVQDNGLALRYGIGIGKDGFSWAGKAAVQRKAIWPSWHPPAEMVRRLPKLQRQGASRGTAPGPDNPLGARALYIYRNGKDTLYRLHGTAEWWSVGKNISAGCIRLFNQDIIDLFDRVPQGAKIVVI